MTDNKIYFYNYILFRKNTIEYASNIYLKILIVKIVGKTDLYTLEIDIGIDMKFYILLYQNILIYTLLYQNILIYTSNLHQGRVFHESSRTGVKKRA